MLQTPNCLKSKSEVFISTVVCVARSKIYFYSRPAEISQQRVWGIVLQPRTDDWSSHYWSQGFHPNSALYLRLKMKYKAQLGNKSDAGNLLIGVNTFWSIKCQDSWVLWIKLLCSVCVGVFYEGGYSYSYNIRFFIAKEKVWGAIFAISMTLISKIGNNFFQNNPKIRQNRNQPEWNSSNLYVLSIIYINRIENWSPSWWNYMV